MGYLANKRRIALIGIDISIICAAYLSVYFLSRIGYGNASIGVFAANFGVFAVSALVLRLILLQEQMS